MRLLLTERFPDRGLDLAWRREVVKTSVERRFPWLVTGRKDGFNRNRNQQNYLSTMENGF